MKTRVPAMGAGKGGQVWDICKGRASKFTSCQSSVNNSKEKKTLQFIYMYINERLPECIYVHHGYSAWGGQKRVSRPLKPELQTVVNSHRGAGN